MVDLFRQRPSLAPLLLRDALGLTLPAFTEARIESAELGEIAPAQFHADLVVLLQESEPVLGIVLEVQLQRDDDKAYTWPTYAVTLRARVRCPTCVLVVTPEEAVGRWASGVVASGPGWSFQPLVVGPLAVPLVTDAAVAATAPELAVLSALAHGSGQSGFDIAVAALGAVAGLPDDAARVYSDLIFAALGKAARVKLEALMDESKYVYKSDFALKHQGIGRQEGRAEGLGLAIVTFLGARGLAVSAPDRQRILGCTDLHLLEEWTRRAAVATSVEDLFRVH
jgi:hypothetical protein